MERIWYAVATCPADRRQLQTINERLHHETSAHRLVHSVRITRNIRPSLPRPGATSASQISELPPHVARPALHYLRFSSCEFRSEATSRQSTFASQISNMIVAPPGIGPVPRCPYPMSGGMINRPRAPSNISAMPSSQPWMTTP